MNKIKIILDIVMTLLMILLMKTNITGLSIHEIIGISIFILFIIHKVLNFKYIKAIGKNIFSKKLKFNSKIMFWLDIILLLFMTINIFSGLMISRFLFKFFSVSNTNTITIVHKCFAWWTLIFISIHIGFHLDRLSNYLKNKFKILKNKYVKIIILVFYLIIAILGIISLNKNSISGKLIPLNKSSEISYNYNEQKNHISKEKEEKTKENEKYGNNQHKNQDLDNNNPKEKENRKNKHRSTIFDVVYIMILFIGISYYMNVYLFNKKIK